MDDMIYMDVTMAEAEVKGTVNTRSRHEKIILPKQIDT